MRNVPGYEYPDVSQVIYQRLAGEGIVSIQIARRGHSSVGRAPALQAGGRRFDSAWLHFRKMKPCKHLHAYGVFLLVLGTPVEQTSSKHQSYLLGLIGGLNKIADTPPRRQQGGGTGPTPHTSPPLKRRFLKKLVALPLAHTHRCQATSYCRSEVPSVSHCCY